MPLDFTGDGDLFMLRVRGDSMIELGILDGDFVIAVQQATAKKGDIVVAGIPGGEATVKTYETGDGKVILDAGQLDDAADGVRLRRRRHDLRPGRHRDAPPLTGRRSHAPSPRRWWRRRAVAAARRCRRPLARHGRGRVGEHRDRLGVRTGGGGTGASDDTGCAAVGAPHGDSGTPAPGARAGSGGGGGVASTGRSGCCGLIARRVTSGAAGGHCAGASAVARCPNPARPGSTGAVGLLRTPAGQRQQQQAEQATGDADDQRVALLLVDAAVGIAPDGGHAWRRPRCAPRSRTGPASAISNRATDAPVTSPLS